MSVREIAIYTYNQLIQSVPLVIVLQIISKQQ